MEIEIVYGRLMVHEEPLYMCLVHTAWLHSSIA